MGNMSADCRYTHPENLLEADRTGVFNAKAATFPDHKVGPAPPAVKRHAQNRPRSVLSGAEELLMKTFMMLILLATAASADDWTQKLSPRMREAFKGMARDDWKPQQAAQLTEQEKRDWTALWEKIEKAPSPAPPPVSVPLEPKVKGK